MRTDILVLLLMLVGGIQVLSFKCDSCGFLWVCFTRLRKFLSTLILLSIFIMKGIRFCQSLYLHLLGWSNGFALTLQLWYIMLVDFHILHQPGIPRVSPAWSWYIILFTCCWIQFGGILLRIFASIFIRAFHLVCLVYPPPHFLMRSLSDFGIRVALVHTEWYGKCYILFYVMEAFIKDSYNSLNVW